MDKILYCGGGETLEQVAQEVVDAPFLEVLKVRLDGTVTNLMKAIPAHGRGI